MSFSTDDRKLRVGTGNRFPIDPAAETGALLAEVVAEMRQIAAPTLVIHRRGDRNVPIDAGRAVASLIPNARFLAIEGTNPGWYTDNEDYADAVREFLSEGEPGPVAQPQRTAADTHTILFTDMQSSTALTQRLGDAAAQEVRRAHNDIVRAALSANYGSEIKHP
ncbi:MAG: alpha/beta hydrolase [Chloroflexi bacterium]|nr:alpha/beta hydrolase [Chloroflexota bacterium]